MLILCFPPSTTTAMEHWGPLIQTVLWVGLIGVALWYFYEPLHGILIAIQRRIEAGSNVKAGPFEISEQLKPQEALQQREKMESEVSAALKDPQNEVMTNSDLSRQKVRIQAKYFQAEDLALRALQAEFGTAISRQVTAGNDEGFDGAFVVNGQFNIVEVKYVLKTISSTKVENVLTRLTSTISRYRWRNVQIILALVYENTADAAEIERLQRIAQQSSVQTVVRIYSLAQLQAKFGVETSIGG